MWSQDYLAAPWTDEQLFTQLNTNFTDPLAGWTLYEDQRATPTYPYAIYRNNLGTGRDILMYVDLTQSTNNVNNTTIRVLFFEKAAYTDGTGTVPVETYHSIGQDLDRNVNLLINHSNTPNFKNMVFWFEQGSVVLPEVSLFSIEPYVQDDGVTLLNTGDDGSSYPLWGGYPMSWNNNAKVGGVYFDRTNANFSVYFTNVQTPKVVVSLPDHPLTWNNGIDVPYRGMFFSSSRTPVQSSYAIVIRGANYYARDEGVYLTLPNKRVPEWSGGATFVEGFRPEIVGAYIDGSTKLIDPRGYLGEPGDLLITRAFGGAKSDSFTSNGQSYRIVSSLDEGTSSTDIKYELAIRVA
jgi:hypothetical protein